MNHTRINKRSHNFLLVCISILLAFFLGSYALESIGIQYVSEGGSPLFKIHAYSYIIIYAFIFTYLRNNSILFDKNEKLLSRALRISLFSAMWLIFYGLYRFGLSGMAYTIDTLLTPLLASFLVMNLTKKEKIIIFSILLTILLVNSTTAIIEALVRQSLFTNSANIMTTFRSTAFFSHPLNNALVTLASMFLFAAHKPVISRAILLSIFCLALIAYGARASLAVALFVGLILIIIAIFNFIYRQQGWKLRSVTLTHIFIMAIPMGMYSILSETDIAERILVNLKYDASVETRVDVYNIIMTLSQNEWLIGASSNVLGSVESLINNSTIENFWIYWLISYGLIGALPMALSLIYLWFCPGLIFK